MQKIYYEPERNNTLRIVVIDRSDAGKRRRVLNNEAMLKALREAFPTGVEVFNFVGREHGVADTMRIFANADVVIGSHGAGLAFTVAMKPKRAVIEIGFDGGCLVDYTASSRTDASAALSMTMTPMRRGCAWHA
jgi:capsular polysaccharide biosynthesis protein